MAHELPALPRTLLLDTQDRNWPVGGYTASQMRDYATAHAASLEAEVERLRKLLYMALPYVEDCEGTNYYKPGSVRKACREIRSALGEPLK